MRGSIRQTRTGGWEVRVGAGRDPTTNRYKQISRYVQGTKTDAQRVLRALVDEVEDGINGPSHTGGPTFGALIDRWLAQTSKRLSPTTLRSYQGYIERNIRPALGHQPLGKVSTAVLNDLYLQLDSQGLSPATVHQVHAIIHRAFRYGINENYGGLITNPATNTTKPRRNTNRIHPPAPVDVLALLNAAMDDDPGFGVVVRLAAAVGARRGELCALRWNDLDLQRGVVTIRRSMAVTPGRTTEKDTKTHQNRNVALDAETREMLGWWWEIAAERSALLAGRHLSREGFVFSRHPAGTIPLHPDLLTRKWVKLCQQLGVECRFHDLRHFNATRLLAAGIPVRIVSGRLGHRMASTTLDIYADWVPECDEEAAVAMGVILGGNNVRAIDV